ncbi:MAG: hypothetical protein ACOC9B_03945 [Chloroflexota bacterium]
MELSPLARQRLEKIGKLSPEEQQKLTDEREVEDLLAPFFAGTSSADDLWQQVKDRTEKKDPDFLRRTQNKLLDSIRLNTSDIDFKRYSDALLGLETLKDSSSYSTIEMLLGTIASLRQRHADVRQQAYEQLRRQVDQQVRAQSEQARQQGLLMDTEASVEASIKAMPEWRDFMSKQEANASQALSDYVSRIRDVL